MKAPHCDAGVGGVGCVLRCKESHSSQGGGGGGRGGSERYGGVPGDAGKTRIQPLSRGSRLASTIKRRPRMAVDPNPDDDPAEALGK